MQNRNSMCLIKVLLYQHIIIQVAKTTEFNSDTVTMATCDYDERLKVL